MEKSYSGKIWGEESESKREEQKKNNNKKWSLLPVSPFNKGIKHPALKSPFYPHPWLTTLTDYGILSTELDTAMVLPETVLQAAIANKSELAPTLPQEIFPDFILNSIFNSAQ